MIGSLRCVNEQLSSNLRIIWKGVERKNEMVDKYVYWEK
ncbi:hypothetical protein PAECIP111891_07019 [Paenibacillus allorhizoplanae]|uniref:Uncharacterized protein n=1 Tax=Paenibacillus allorhizoplanae TaxID=2905648 RepID=A0ABM9D1L5_9BACL|nr:hypothetical protein PAECIP111891_07019 [Paenibacillus allorhizoplanae]